MSLSEDQDITSPSKVKNEGGLKKFPKMTCIIGGICKDGVALVADRKVRYDNGNIFSEDKIFLDYYPFVIASSGSTRVFHDFRDKAKQTAQELLGIYENGQFKKIPFDSTNISGIVHRYNNSTIYPVIRYNEYIEKIRDIVRTKKQDIKQNKDLYQFDVLVASQTDDGKAHLSYIDDNGTLNEIYERYIIIGSDTAPQYGSMFLKAMLRDDMNTKQFVELAYFTIKYIDRFKLEDRIGLEGGEPLVYIIPNTGPIDRAPLDLLEEWKSNTNKMLDNISKQGISKLL